MAYSTATDLQNYLPAEQVRQLTDDNDTDDIDLEKLNDAIRRADDLIDSYIRGRYTVPLVNIPALIRDMSTKLASYFLFKRSLILTLPDPIKEDYSDANNMLMKIQRGQVTPFEQQDEPVFFNSNKVSGQGSSVINEVTQNWGAYLI
jgi:phage gp36-like protein